MTLKFQQLLSDIFRWNFERYTKEKAIFIIWISVDI